jgi:hypothetical protein
MLRISVATADGSADLSLEVLASIVASVGFEFCYGNHLRFFLSSGTPNFYICCCDRVRGETPTLPM